MGTMTRRYLVAASAAMAFALAGASFAWACTSQPVTMYGDSQTPGSGPAGEWVRVRGTNWDAAPVDIKWNSATGPNLQTDKPVEGPSFDVMAQIPADARPDVYTIYFVQTQRKPNAYNATITGTSRMSFEVTPGPRSEPNYQGTNEGGQQGQTSGSTSGADGTSQSSGGSGTTSGGDGSGTAAASAGGEYGSIATPRSGAQSTAAPTGSEAPANSNQAPAAGSAATPAPASAGSGGATADAAAADQEQRPTLSASTANGDLWSGFRAGPGSLTHGLADPASSDEAPGLGFAMALVLLIAGLVSLAGGFTVAELRRKRVLAPSEARRSR